MSKELEPWQQRVVEERAQLADRVEKLTVFRTTDEFFRLPVLDRDRLYRQLAAMKIYLAILDERIAWFNHGS